MTQKRKLMQRLDTAAELLLDRYFQPTVIGETPPEAKEQIDAFKAVVTYFGPRTKLGGDEDKHDSPFEQLRNGLSRKTTGRSRGGPPTNGTGDDTAGNA